MTTYHIYMPIDSAERMNDRELESMFNGNAASIRAELTNMKARGMNVIPSEGCDNQDVTGRCLGH